MKKSVRRILIIVLAAMMLTGGSLLIRQLIDNRKAADLYANAQNMANFSSESLPNPHSPVSVTPPQDLVTPEDHVVETPKKEPMDDYALQLVCEVEGKIVGTCNISRHRLRKVRHRGDVGLCILQEYWGLGIGKAMFAALTAQAERWGLSQLELEVVDINERGIALYRKLGFKVYGERPDGVILPDGRALKDLLMVKKL
jgi:RimJ/RimL family protein N-acetyltransferase